MTETQPKPKRSLAGIAGIVAIATLISKVVGLVRQLAIAFAFGVGTAKAAYDISAIIPSFFLILLGGINGPFHSGMVSALAKRKKEDSAPLVEAISTLIGSIFLVVAIVVFIFAPFFIDLLASGLQQTAQGLETRAIAIQQLRIMAPIAWFAGMIGIGFGTLNAADQYWLPSISPLLSSLTLIAGIGIFILTAGSASTNPNYALIGGIVLAFGTLIGTVLQWLAQFWAQRQSGLGRFRMRFVWNDPGVQEVLRVMGPALFSSGMLQINVITDLTFAAFLPNAVAAIASLDYANLLVQTPLGILSNMILVPLLPTFSRLADPSQADQLKQRIRQGILGTAVVMLPLSALMISLATPIVRVVYERGAFKPEASQLVASVLMAYAVGMFVYLSRDVLVRVFYGLGDGDTPFKISMVNIFLNALFDFLFYKPFGIVGIVLATVSVNILSVFVLLYFLNRRLGGLPLFQWGYSILGLASSSILAGTASWFISNAIANLSGFKGFFLALAQTTIAGSIGLVVFALLATQLKLEEVDQFVDRIRQRFSR
ncbi:murein biosynthesis integral membrane protein MurJ [Leptolyngbya boryana CZ1]|uniref:Probable lipid II flippase MurJ n=2 Tax=Leptolyngbya boryana TaxID=1184 RepID=A0A1Z4J9K8_LEPBY|nr:murein biosynthesis integral membrane protein MurJ [Leptolyngbya boryana]MBD2366777.1 murein biosynthesis integral membrane protein MurJ [Leptolyngbya sp. FACHB-161]MBD2373208.1 murein biosynthesis integral membrane protein MurJ [Leptolyngbya sp. FACHB-238]MBD2397609.1 murein biosynthesis integral membrane protein MurJ [Leptolyngbya sp. FACHB-239]MBD2404753.1 murein biosynthesis integral membrane protein MurJ [Leptolyngbya sp. FACHB-402]BAY53358.1 integral membrane protein MviN [Leptolyngby